MDKTYEEVADRIGLKPEVKERFLKYMRKRWASDEELKCKTGYAYEWATRFKLNIAWESSDRIGRRVLEEIDAT